jgi:hypothetical protein
MFKKYKHHNYYADNNKSSPQWRLIMHKFFKGYKGSNLIEYVIPIAVIGMAVGIGIYSMFGSDNIKNYFIGTTDAQIENDEKIIINSNVDATTGTTGTFVENGVEVINIGQETTGGVASLPDPTTTPSVASAKPSTPSTTEPIETTATLANAGGNAGPIYKSAAYKSASVKSASVKSASSKTAKSAFNPNKKVVKMLSSGSSSAASKKLTPPIKAAMAIPKAKAMSLKLGSPVASVMPSPIGGIGTPSTFKF